ncbi:thioredoxin family protein [Candidatus Clostridium radicumherbarum]|uniref:Thioredoxin family protein n=1 Tax=Candidatus Clostridium radicumherbarum TaxID=3381662 RepID=A0ABW8TNZ8_9CLOT
MIELSKGMDFKGYLNKNSKEESERLVNNLDKIELSKEVYDAAKEIKENVNVVVFSEGYCPDCIATLPFIKRLSEVNDKIKVFYYGLKGNEKLLEEYTGTSRIPTIMSFTENMEPKGAYIEVPAELSEKMARLSNDKQKELVTEYRQGKYNDLIEKELIGILK